MAKTRKIHLLKKVVPKAALLTVAILSSFSYFVLPRIDFKPQATAGNTVVFETKAVDVQPGWTSYQSKLINLTFAHPESWGEPEENLIVTARGKQYVLSFTQAKQVFAGSRTPDYTDLDPQIIEVTISHVERKFSKVTLYLGDRPRYIVTNYTRIKKTVAGEVGFGNAPEPGISGFEAGDLVGIIDLAEGDFKVLVLHSPKSVLPVDLQTFLESVAIR